MDIYKKSVLLFLLFVCVSSAASAQASNCNPWVAMAISVQGVAEQRIVGNDQNENQGKDQETWQTIERGKTFCPNDILRVRENSRVALILSNNTVVRLDESTTISFSSTSPDASSMDLKAGIAHFISRVKQAFKVITPFVNASIEGTEFVVNVEPEQSQVSVFEGIVKAENEKGHVRLTQGQTAVALRDQAPVLKTVVNPRDAVQWALYYPTIMRESDINPQLPDEIRDKLARSMMLHTQGKTTSALNVIDDLPSDITYAVVYSYRASLRLAVGRIEKAQQDIEQALSIDKYDSHALALKSIIAIVQNRHEDASSLAEQAVKNDPNNASAQLALSYARQAMFDINAALQAMDNAPDNALTHSRRAELYLMQGDFDRGLEYARKAVDKNLDSSHAQTVLGFVHLIRIKTDAAKAAFNKAITLEQTNPLAHLGFGLALIREGELQQGRREIEYAASLDPDNSLIRSYLGKAYYEENRNRLAADQFEMAKALDPNDPTPWFYSAIQKQGENDLAGGLEDLQKSINLNDNRIVYRSRLLLDSDDATRSTSMAHLYRELGFEQLGLVEARKSLSHDPDNYSAHRFLADSYLTQPRHEIARVSELMQSQLLQPLNILPVQPQLAESSLGIVHGTGGLRTGYNEYNSLFMQNQFAFFANGLAGSFGTRANDIVHSGLIDNFSYSLGSYHYYSRGYRENNDRDYVIDNAFLQVAMSPKASAQFEYRKFKNNKGDTSLNFDPTKFSTTFRETTDSDVYRVGLSYLLSNSSRLIGSIVNEDLSVTQQVTETAPTPSQDITRNGDGTLYEFQYFYKNPGWNIVSGIGSFQADSKTELNFDFSPFPCLLPSCTVIIDEENKHDNFYIYSNLKYSHHAITVGISSDYIKNNIADFDELNPKFGLTWDLNNSSTIRAALFKAVKRDLLTDQTIEPTHITGFNQFFDDRISTKSTVAGLALDNKLSNRLFAGVNFHKRTLDVPYLKNASETKFADWKEKTANTYLSWAGNRDYSINIQLNYEEFERSKDFTSDFLKLFTYSAPIDINMFIGYSVKLNLNTTYIRQKGDYFDSTTVPPATTPGEDEFWVFNAELEIRIPGTSGYLNIGTKNLLDEEFNYYEVDVANPAISRERFGYVTAEFSF